MEAGANMKNTIQMVKPVICLLILCLLLGCAPQQSLSAQPSTQHTTQAPVTTEADTTEPDTTREVTEPPVTTTEPETTEPEAETFVLSFAGDCTLGTDHNSYGAQGTFVNLVGENYGYPFENVLPYFANDDFTFINLEGVFTDSGTPAEKMFRFRGPTRFAAILPAGSIEVVSLANNHTLDYGQTGYKNTKAALESENITYVEHLKTAMYTTESGLKIGLFGVNYTVGPQTLKNNIAKLKTDGAEVIIVAFHWGIEGSYRTIAAQVNLAHAAIDAGADIVVGHHPHVLQPMEEYKDGIIYYSLGNFSFGGNRNPQDKDTAVIQQVVIREPDGTVHLGDTIAVACRLSSVAGYNDYRPTPYADGSAEQLRVLSKLDGTFTGPDLVLDRPSQETTEPETTEPEVTTEPAVTDPPESTDPPAETEVPTVPPETQAPTVSPETEAPTVPPETQVPTVSPDPTPET